MPRIGIFEKNCLVPISVKSAYPVVTYEISVALYFGRNATVCFVQ